MSLSIIWGAYAAAMLAVGFWRNVRLLRFSALALFGATALKLVLVDMARVEEVLQNSLLLRARNPDDRRIIPLPPR